MQEETSLEAKRNFFERFKSQWPNIRLLLEALSFALLCSHLVPDNARETLRQGFLGVFIILGFIMSLIIAHSMQQSRVLNSNQIKHEDKLTQKDEEINGFQKELAVLTKEVVFKTNVIKELTSYKNIFALDNKTFASLRDAHRENLVSNEQNQLKFALREFCNNINEIFSTLKGVENKECHVCIKILTQPANHNFKVHQVVKVKVKTLMRDGRGDGSRSKIDTSKIEHLLVENTDFLAIFEQTAELSNRCFMSNDLMVEGYRNSSFKRHNRDKVPYHIPGTKWPLSYRSCITAPICPGITQLEIKDGTLIGFLCVDFVSPNQFDENDVHIVAGHAEALYDVLNHYIKKYILKT